jgi:hypothetical protein
VWTGKGTLTDFKIAKRVDLGLFPSLALVDEGAEYSYASGERSRRQSGAGNLRQDFLDHPPGHHQ